MKKKVVIITGCSAGLGLNLLEKFVLKNYKVYGFSRSEKKINKAKNYLNSKKINKKNYKIEKLNVTNLIKVKKFIHKIKKKEKKIDVLINNAGVIGPLGKFEKNDIKIWKSAFEINFFGSMYLYKEIVPIMKEQNYGRIVQMSGGGATKAFPMYTSYSSAKAAIVRLSETISEEVKEFNIKINSVAPGILKTDFLDQALNKGPDKIGEEYFKKLQLAKKRGGDDMLKSIRLIEYLCSENCKITGKLISALWDKWEIFKKYNKILNKSDIYTIRRIIGKDRGLKKFDV